MSSQVEDLILQMKETKQAIKFMEDELKACMAKLDEYRANGLLDSYEGEDGTFYISECRLLPVTPTLRPMNARMAPPPASWCCA
jgi:hypothetical protein